MTIDPGVVLEADDASRSTASLSIVYRWRGEKSGGGGGFVDKSLVLLGDERATADVCVAFYAAWLVCE